MGAFRGSLRCYAHPWNIVPLVHTHERHASLLCAFNPAAAPGLRAIMVFQLALEAAPHPPSLSGPGAATRSPADLHGDASAARSGRRETPALMMRAGIV